MDGDKRKKEKESILLEWITKYLAEGERKVQDQTIQKTDKRTEPIIDQANKP